MKKIGILLTSSTTEEIVNKCIVEPLNEIFKSYIIINDDILNLVAKGKNDKIEKLITREIKKFKAKKILNIIFACSSISCFKKIAIKEGVRIFAIDDFMGKESRRFKKIEFLGTVPSALKNSNNLFDQSQTIDNHLIKKAFNFLLAGNREKHNKIITDYISSLPKNTQCIVLAQISMLYALPDILKKTKTPILSGATTLVKGLLSQSKPCGIKLYNSISYIKNSDKNKFIISGSHGGIPSVKYAIDKKIFGAIFNDAGVGKNKAGISGLSILEKNNILGITIDANSAEIGNALDSYNNGLISHFNNVAKNFGAQKGMKVNNFINSLLSFK